MTDVKKSTAGAENSNESIAETNRRLNRPRIGGLSALVAAIALVAVAFGKGDFTVVQGAVSAVVVLASWYFLPPTYVFALGHVALVALLPESGVIPDTALLRVAAVEVGLLGVLLAPMTTLSTFSQSDESGGLPLFAVSCTFLTIGWVFSGGALAWASTKPLLWPPLAGTLLIGLTGLVVYGLHRYQLVALGVVGQSHELKRTPQNPEDIHE